MKRLAAELEDLPPLEVRVLRDLRLREPSAPGRPSHLSAASGVVRRGAFAYVIGDDELSIGVFSLAGDEPGELRRVLEGDLPTDPDERKQHKADLEALALLPPSREAPFGSLLGLGSGSAQGDRRDRGFAWDLAADGTLSGEPVQLDLRPLFGRLREEVDALNIEGVSVIGDRLWLLQRGNDAQGLNLVAELDLEQVLRSLRTDRELDAAELADLRRYDLGDLDGVPLTFSDATPLGRDVLVFTASAEADDGAIHGSVVGTIDPDGEVRRLRTIDRRFKVEGVHAAMDTGVADFVFVCDQDDPSQPSPLLSAAMPLEPGVERAS